MQIALHNLGPPNGNHADQDQGRRKKQKKPKVKKTVLTFAKLTRRQNMQDEKMGTARMDLMFLCLFPCFFLIFNMVYWLSFLWIYPS